MYFPKSQITTDLTSNGNLAIKSNNKPYFGLYYSTSNGKFYTGATSNSEGNLELVLITSENSPPTFEPGDIDAEGIDLRFSSILTNSYSNLKNISDDSTVPSPPKPYSSTPTPKDYQIGEFQRYFAKKTNELIYIEISKETYNKFINQDSKVAFDLYNTISLPWNLIGKEKQVYQSNKKIVELVERENNWYGFTSYFRQEFSKYYNPIKENLFTSGGEYTTKDGKEYIGDYHIHPDIKQPSTPLTTPTTPSYSPPSTSGGGGGY